MKTAEEFYLEKTGWQNINSVEELDSPKDVINMIDEFSKEKEAQLIKFMEWVLNNCEIPNNGYVWKYKKEYYTSKQLFNLWKDLFSH